MRTLNITIRNNKVLKILSSMEKLDLITINEIDSDESRWGKLLEKIHKNGQLEKISLAEITKEIEIVRTSMHKKRQKIP